MNKVLGILLLMLWSPLLLTCYVIAAIGVGASYIFECIFEPIYDRYLK